MDTGIIYVMTTIVPGLVVLGSCETDEFEGCMWDLERNGYFNVVGLRRRFAVEVEGCDEKASLLYEVFDSARVPESELFALDVSLVVELLSAFAGRQVYPTSFVPEDYEESALTDAADAGEPDVPAPVEQGESSMPGHVGATPGTDTSTGVREDHESEIASSTKEDFHLRFSDVPGYSMEARGRAADAEVPDGIYYLRRRLKQGGRLDVKMVVRGGRFIIPAGEHVSTHEGPGLRGGTLDMRRSHIDEKGLVTEDAVFGSPSTAGGFAIGGACNGWVTWKTADGRDIGIFRHQPPSGPGHEG